MAAATDAFPCAEAPASVHGTNAPAVCSAAARAQRLMGRCGVPPVDRPIRIDVVDAMESDCLGRYHCGEDRIELLAPDAMHDAVTPDGIFAPMTPSTLFESVVVHEFVHAAMEGHPCPFDACPATQEYAAYTLQILSMPAGDRERITKRVEDMFDAPIEDMELNPFVAMMAPDRFALKAWAHLLAREEGCAFVGAAVSGRATLDAPAL
ncbi:DUF6639 family protein [Jannaschia sp. W003]|uniref:DUF6639 family protein n=1 Tax=Jannaschia sp. W003 TaxID=2867012 RepID=UPI0021A8E082|nr:DUF6639 family protein [Jannaschia sp. W003]UWQ22008.1 hypothetical protein K3554_02955 [Jannaschia sp. W003]